VKIDLSKLPVGEAIIGFLILSLIITFVLAFTHTNDQADEQALSAPEPTEPSETEDGDGDGGGTGTPAPDGNEIDVVLGDNFFDPEQLTVPAGAAFTFNVTNEGNIAHNMHISGQGGEYSQPFCDAGGDDPCSDPNNVRGGETAVLEWDVPDAGGEEVPFRCDFHPEEMTGTITIQ
jgi:plastocyanin